MVTYGADETVLWHKRIASFQQAMRCVGRAGCAAGRRPGMVWESGFGLLPHIHTPVTTRTVSVLGQGVGLPLPPLPHALRTPCRSRMGSGLCRKGRRP